MKRAFTLIEILTVTAIMAILAGLLFPVIVGAKKRAKDAVTISNLRQASLVLIMYCDDHDGIRSMPSYDTAKTILAKSPTCDSLENWRTNCKQDWGNPLIGSYGYVRGVPDFVTKDEDWDKYIADMNGDPTLLVSPWHGQFPLCAFHGDVVPFCLPVESHRYPNRMAFAQSDGSVALKPNGYAGTVDGGGQNFTWSGSFYANRPRSQ